MNVLLIKAILILTLVLGPTGGAAAIAANSLPDTPLYPAKLAMEQARLNLTSDPAEQAALHMTRAQVRVQEMIRLALVGEVPDEAIQLRLRQHLHQALQLAAGLPDDEMADVLTQAQQMLQNQEQEMEQAQTRVGEPAQEPLGQALGLLQQTRAQVRAGLQDPQTFRWQYGHGPRPEDAPGPGQPGGNPDCPGDDCEPEGEQNQYGPQPDQPGPGQPGGNPDCPDDDCKPEGEQNQNGPQPDQPGPGQPGGNPDCPDDDCKPEGEQNQNGPQPDQPGPGQPGGNPDCPDDDCEPEGEQNQNGPQPDQPGPGQPGGNPDCPDDGCEPEGEQNQNGPQPADPPGGEGSGDGGGTGGKNP
jgi:hypothetical protein